MIVEYRVKTNACVTNLDNLKNANFIKVNREATIVEAVNEDSQVMWLKRIRGIHN